MSTILQQIGQDLGWSVSNGGLRATCPAPGHSKADRSMSLMLKANGEIVVNCFSGRTDWRECRRFLEDRGYIDRFSKDRTSPSRAATVTPPPAGPDPIKLARVKTLWERSTPTLKTLVVRYLTQRGLAGTFETSSELGYLDSCDHRPYGSKYPPFRFSPAMLAPIRDGEGAHVGLHITYLDRKTGYRRTDDPSRKIIGQMAGGAIQLHPIRDDTLLVAEGIETALSAGRRFDATAWSLVSAVNMASWQPPAGVKRLLIASDTNPVGRDAAFALAATAKEAGLKARVLISPEGTSDWNDLDTRCG